MGDVFMHRPYWVKLELEALTERMDKMEAHRAGAQRAIGTAATSIDVLYDYEYPSTVYSHRHTMGAGVSCTEFALHAFGSILCIRIKLHSIAGYPEHCMFCRRI